MTEILLLDDRFVDPATASVPFFDRGYLYGDSVFETLRAYGGACFRLGRHLERLAHGAAVLGIVLPIGTAALAARVAEALWQSALPDAYLRITVSRGVGEGRLSPAGGERPRLSILVRPFAPYPAAAYERGIESTVVATRRVPALCLDPAIKGGSCLSAIQARRELAGRGLVEGVQRAVGGELVSGTVSNLFLVAGARLRTPDLASGCLPGVTREAVLEIAPAAGLTPVEERLAVADLAAADEVFFTNTLMECLPVARLDGRGFRPAPGPATTAISRAFRELVRRELAGAAGAR